MEGPVAPPKKLPSFEENVKKVTGQNKASDAHDESEKVIRNYTQQYETLKLPKQKPSQENNELRQEVEKDKTKTDVLNRLAQFTSIPVGDWFGILLDVIIAILGLVLVYLVFSRVFASATEVVVESSDVTI